MSKHAGQQHRAMMNSRSSELESVARIRAALTGKHHPGTGKHRANDTEDAA